MKNIDLGKRGRRETCRTNKFKNPLILIYGSYTFDKLQLKNDFHLTQYNM